MWAPLEQLIYEDRSTPNGKKFFLPASQFLAHSLFNLGKDLSFGFTN